jgi:hypothetical protein
VSSWDAYACLPPHAAHIWTPYNDYQRNALFQSQQQLQGLQGLQGGGRGGVEGWGVNQLRNVRRVMAHRLPRFLEVLAE